MLFLRAQHIAAVLLALLGPAHANPEAAALLFEVPALADVPTGATLVYRFEHTGTRGPTSAPAESRIELSLRPDGASGRDAAIETVTDGGRHRAGSFPSGVGNPVLLVVLERDVTEMARQLGGSPYYIRNRIREAIGASAPAAPTRLRYGDREVEGWRIEASPFAQDRHRDKLGDQAAKRYTFVISEAVPGRLHEIRMVTPAPDGAPLVEDRLIFERIEPAREEAR